MWKKFMFTIIMGSVLASAWGCGKKEEPAVRNSAEVSVLPDNTYSPEPSDKSEDNATSESEAVTEEVTLYLPDENVEYLIPTTVQAQRSPQGIIKALVEAEALPEGTEINKFLFKDNKEIISFEDGLTSTSDGKTAEIDLSDAFMEAVQNTGTAGEAMYMGCVVNSLTENFHLQSIMVSANDEIIETGHCIYDEPISFYENLVK